MNEPKAEPESIPKARPVTVGLQGYSPESVRTTCLLVLTLLASSAALYWLRPVVVPFLVALALYYLLTPVSDWLVRKTGIPESLGVLGAALLGLVVVALTGFLIWVCVVEVIRDADVYSMRLTEALRDPRLTQLIQLAGFNHDADSGQVSLITPEQTRQLVLMAVGWLQTILTDTSLVIVFLVFMLMGRTGVAHKQSGLPEEVAQRVRRYLIEMFVFSAITGILVGGILGVLGINFWISFGFFAFVLNFIPTIGPILATLLPIPVVLIDPRLSVTVKVLAILLPALLQTVIGTIVQPRFQSRTQGIHPVATMMAIIVFGMLWGPVGAILAVPLAAILKITLVRIPGGKGFGNLLAGEFEGTQKSTEVQ
jgi:AI-2 transport protein TqsA